MFSVYSPNELTNFIKNDNSVVEIKKSNKDFKGVYFHKINIKDPRGSKTKKDLFIRLKNVPVNYGIFSKDIDDKNASKSVSLMVNIDEIDDYKNFIEEFEKIFINWVKTDDQIPDSKRGSIVNIIQREYSDACKNEELRGKQKENPTTKFKLDFSTYSDKYPIENLKGVKKTLIYDFDTKYVSNGKIHYKLATIEGKEVDEYNIHKFITMGSTITDMRIHFNNVTRSNFGISCTPLISTLVVKRASADELFEGDYEEAKEEEQEQEKSPQEDISAAIDEMALYEGEPEEE